MLHFLDSGAFSIRHEFKKTEAKEFFRSQYFWDYVDEYAAFVKRYSKTIDHYANVDTTAGPKMTWKVQRYLEEEHGLHPLPVVHHGEPLRWLEKYIDRGYKYICIGGVAKGKGYQRWKHFLDWGDRAFNIICSGKDNLPVVKTHGFAITTNALLRRYPWYSVDSVTWKKMAYYGQILVPPMKDGKFSFVLPNLVIFVDPKTKYTLREGSGRHFLHLSKASQMVIRQWLDLIEVPFGKSTRRGSIIERGVCNDEIMRRAATIHYYLEFVKTLPPWPWPFHILPPAPTLEELCK